ncbi:hypothetical protein BDF20DRAFT_838838 [Mycotypha africana]|uniref:uncharacterized protein n=1 Tax=Mycotypha africana TaxID=64632 RepID=UPI0022FFCB56|nr:uncharacterized protein BDF20DRAFT_838838 [Mycotypha africana]KAI8970490.1 hypothetical protein BDF20DRAFT_838838 [Mycotypha africana]
MSQMMRTSSYVQKVIRTGDKSKKPLVLFDDGLTNRAQVRFKGLQAGVSNKIYKHLKTKEEQGLVLVIDIDEFRTSKICNSCRSSDVRKYRARTTSKEIVTFRL